MTTGQNKIGVILTRLEGLKDRKKLELNAENVRIAGMYLVEGGEPTNTPYRSALCYTIENDIEAIQYGIEAVKTLSGRV